MWIEIEPCSLVELSETGYHSAAQRFSTLQEREHNCDEDCKEIVIPFTSVSIITECPDNTKNILIVSSTSESGFTREEIVKHVVTCLLNVSRNFEEDSSEEYAICNGSLTGVILTQIEGRVEVQADLDY